jgi:O-antigen/teichoic acid export membrane protein
MLNKIFKAGIFQKGSFIQNTLLLSSASAWGMVIQFAFAPILSRIYDAEVYGVFAIFGTFLNMVMTLVMLGYNRALLLPREQHEFKALLRLALLLSTLTALTLSLIFLFFGKSIATFFSADGIGWWIYLVGPIALISAYDQYVVSWTMQARAYRKSSLASIPLSLASKSFNVAYGRFISPSVDGLIYTHLIAALSRIVVHFCFVTNNVKQTLLGAVSRDALRNALANYRDYPRYVVWSNLLNQLSNYVPILVLPLFLLNTAAVGFYTYAVMLLELPVRLLSAGLAQVFLQESADLWKTNPDAVRSKTRKLFQTLLLAALAPTLLLYFFGETLFAWLFGEDWAMAGQAAAVLAFSYLFRYISVPLSSLYTVTRNEAKLFRFQIALFVLRLAGIAIPGWLNLGFVEMMGGFAIANILAYGWLCIGVFRVVHAPLARWGTLIITLVVATCGLALFEII